jgi:hypothetical protein
MLTVEVLVLIDLALILVCTFTTVYLMHVAS